MHEIRTQPLTSEMQTQTTVLPVNSPKMTDTKDDGNVSEGGIILHWWECKLAKPLRGRVWPHAAEPGAHSGSAAWAAAGCAVRTLVAMDDFLLKGVTRATRAVKDSSLPPLDQKARRQSHERGP